MPGFEIFGDEERKQVNDVLESGVLMRYGFDGMRNNHWKAKEFETGFAHKMGVDHCQLVSNGTAALTVALAAAGIGAGDEVIMPCFTFVASFESILAIGAIPVLVDIDATLTLDPAAVAAAVTSKTRCVMPVHMCGSMANLDALQAICNKHDLLLLEDEGRLIGRLHLPPPLQAAMKAASLVVLQASFEARARRIHQDYILDNWGRFEGVYGDDAFTAFSEYLLQALHSIQKRLGGVGFEACQNKLADALLLQSRGDTSGHLGWIEYLLANYYDPMYTYQLNQKAERIVFQGDAAEIRDYLADARAKRGS